MATLRESIIEELGAKPTIDAAAEVRSRVQFLKDYVRSTPPPKDSFWESAAVRTARSPAPSPNVRSPNSAKKATRPSSSLFDSPPMARRPTSPMLRSHSASSSRTALSRSTSSQVPTPQPVKPPRRWGGTVNCATSSAATSRRANEWSFSMRLPVSSATW